MSTPTIDLSLEYFISKQIKYILPKDLQYPLYHISFSNKLSGVWYPRNADAANVSITKDINDAPLTEEPQDPRICFSPSLQQCFRAIYPNVYEYFEDKNYPNMEFYVYTPEFEGTERIVVDKTITKYKYVHDAHLTGEHWIMDNVRMKLIKKISVLNTNKSESLMAHPFDDKSNELFEYGPTKIEVVVLDSAVETYYFALTKEDIKDGRLRYDKTSRYLDKGVHTSIQSLREFVKAEFTHSYKDFSYVMLTSYDLNLGEKIKSKLIPTITVNVNMRDRLINKLF